MCCALACELGRVSCTPDLSSTRSSSCAFGALPFEFKAMRSIVPFVCRLLKLALISREVFHQLEYGLPLGIEVCRLLLVVCKLIDRFLELSTRPFRTA